MGHYWSELKDPPSWPAPVRKPPGKPPAIAAATGPDPGDPWAEWVWVVNPPGEVAARLDQPVVVPTPDAEAE